MNILARLCWLPFNDRFVDNAIIPSLAKTLGSFVKARGLSKVPISDDLLDDLLAEAIERAAHGEVDGKPRYRMLWLKMEEIADAVANAYNGRSDSDPAVSEILEKHRLKNPLL